MAVERPLDSMFALCIPRGGDDRYPLTTGDYGFEPNVSPPAAST
jgi:hypothetical protein